MKWLRWSGDFVGEKLVFGSGYSVEGLVRWVGVWEIWVLGV